MFSLAEPINIKANWELDKLELIATDKPSVKSKDTPLPKEKEGEEKGKSGKK